MVTPLGCGVNHNWNELIKGSSGAGIITRFNIENLGFQKTTIKTVELFIHPFSK